MHKRVLYWKMWKASLLLFSFLKIINSQNNLPHNHLRHVIFYEYSKGTSAAQTAKNINAVYGEDSISTRTCERWFPRFKQGSIDLEDEPHSGRPSELNEPALLALLAEDNRQSTRDFAEQLGTSHSTVEDHLKALGYKKKYGAWIPHHLNDADKWQRMSISANLLSRYHRGAPNAVHQVHLSNGFNFGKPDYRSTIRPSQPDVCYLHVPSDKAGLVIGKGGATINQIRGESGALVELSDEPTHNPAVKTVVIKGWPYQIQRAQHIVHAILGDVPVSTPVSSLQGQMMGGNICGSNPQQLGNNNIWDNTPPAGAQSNLPDYSAQWMAYYRATGQHEAAALLEKQIQQRNQFTLCPPIQQRGDAHYSVRDVFSTNNAQPDYSAQWIEYYRAMGMHDQANGLENQMKQKLAQG